MTRAQAIDGAAEHMRSGAFLAELERRVAYRTESQRPGREAELRAYLDAEMRPELERMGFLVRVDAPAPGQVFLVATREEDPALPTALIYGHGDTVNGMEGRWRESRDPWRVTPDGDRLYGRGTADNKGQHSINLAALEQVRAARGGTLGFNCKLILEMGEETGSPGLRAYCAANREALAADLLIASDGPRLSSGQPTIFLGARGGVQIRLRVDLRDGAHHSGNWGGLLSNAGTILAGAIASMVDARGRTLVPALQPPPIPPEVRAALAGFEVVPGPDEPALAEGWGEPGLSTVERLYAWNTLEVLAMGAGDVAAPVNAIPGTAEAVLQLRFVVGTKSEEVGAALRAHLDAIGLPMVQVEAKTRFPATRTSHDSPWVDWARDSIGRTTGKAVAVLPNFGGSLPNDVFADELGLPTLWVPHSYPGSSQHAPDEHMLASLAEEALQVMAGLFWDLGEEGPAVARRVRAG